MPESPAPTITTSKCSDNTAGAPLSFHIEKGSIGHIDCATEELHQRAQCRKRDGHFVDKLGRRGKLRALLAHRVEAFPLDVFDEGVFRSEPAWRTDERLAAHSAEIFCERLIREQLLPPRGFRRDTIADLCQSIGWRHPQSAAKEYLAWREMHVETGRMRVLAECVAEMAGGMLLVRTFVLREAHVAIDAEHGAAVRPRIGGKMFRDFREPWRHRRDEIAHRRLYAVAKA